MAPALGRGLFGDREWVLRFLESPEGPVVLFGGRGIYAHLRPSHRPDASFGRVGLLLKADDYDTSFWALREARTGFNEVLLQGEDGSEDEAAIVDCEERFGFSFYVAITRSKPVAVVATTPDEISETRIWPQ